MSTSLRGLAESEGLEPPRASRPLPFSRRLHTPTLGSPGGARGSRTRPDCFADSHLADRNGRLVLPPGLEPGSARFERAASADWAKGAGADAGNRTPDSTLRGWRVSFYATSAGQVGLDGP